VRLIATPTDSNSPATFRSNIYRILALSFAPPRTESKNLYVAILEALAILRSTGADPSEGVRFSDLSREHLRLFVGPGHIQCPPYEAVYRKDKPLLEKGLVMGPSMADVRRRYAEANVAMSQKFTDLPDHIAVEMEFMYFLCIEESKFTEQRNNEELSKIRKMQQEFLDEHLKPWVNDFANCVLQSSNSSFFKASANLLKAFIESESEHFREGERQ